MTPKSSCPNCRRLLAELERLRAQWEEAQAQLEEARKRIAVLEAEVRRGRRSAAPFSRDEPKPDPKPLGRRPGRGPFRYRSRPPEEAIQETIEVPLEACPACGGPLEDRATHEQVQVDIPEVRPVIPRFRTESGYCRRCRKRVRPCHGDGGGQPRAEGEGAGGGLEASAGDSLREGGGVVSGGLGSGGDGLGPVPGR
jgi:transposase